MAGTRSIIPLEYTKLSSRVILACAEHPQVLRTYAVLEQLAWGAESRTVEFDGDFFEKQFGIPQPTLLRHLNLLHATPIQAVLCYRSAGSGYRRFSVSLAEMTAVDPSGIKIDTVSNMIIPVVVLKESNNYDSINTNTTGIKFDTVSKTIPEKSNIFALHEEHFGALTPFLASALRDAEQNYPPEWIEAAFEISVGSNKRFWAYAEGILKKWKAAGKMNFQEKPNATNGKPSKNAEPETTYSDDDLAAAAAVLAMRASVEV